MKNKLILFLGIFLATSVAALAQDNISPKRKQAIDSLAFLSTLPLLETKKLSFLKPIE